MGTHMCPREQTGKLSPFRCPPEGGTMCVCVHVRACVLVKWGVECVLEKGSGSQQGGLEGVFVHQEQQVSPWSFM